MLAVLGAVLREVEPLFEALQCGRPFSFHGETFRVGTCGGGEVVVGTTGLGKVNAAVTTAALLERLKITRVFNVGCSGAYADGPLRVGDVIVTSRFLLGDEGVLTEKGRLPVEEIGIPILVHEGRAFFDDLPAAPLAEELMEKTPEGLYGFVEECGTIRVLFMGPGREKDESGADAAASAKEPAGGGGPEDSDAGTEGETFRLFRGPSLTVGMASGDASIAGKRFRKYRAWAENMEGSAVAHACLRMGVPFVECRGISNIAGNRRKGEWRIETAAAHCHGIVLHRFLSPDAEGGDRSS